MLIVIAKKFRLLLVAALAWLCICTPAARAERIDDAALGFSLKIPDGFERDAQLAGSNHDFVHGFRKLDDSGVDTLIIIERMHGTIGRERFDPAKAPADFKGHVFNVNWNGLDIDAMEVVQQANGIEILSYNVQVPLRSEAIQLRVVGRRDDAPQLRALLDQLLSGLGGESNWLKSAAPPGIANLPHYGILLLSVTGVGVIAGFGALWLIRRRTPRGAILILAVLIYAASVVLGPGKSREMRALIQGMRMLGLLGFLLGVVDLFRKAGKQPVEKLPIK